MSDAKFLNDKQWKILVANYLAKHKESIKYYAKELKPGENLEPTDMDAMAKAFGEERKAIGELRDYEKKLGYFE